MARRSAGGQEKKRKPGFDVALLVSECCVDENLLAERFCNIWERAGGTGSREIWQTLRDHYQEPHRHYHTLKHVAQCLRELDNAGEHIAETTATELAIWFHDVIYVYGARDNEARSAEFFRDQAHGSMSAELVERVCEFIMATQHTGSAQDESVALLVDIDLSGFGLPWEDYLADSDALRLEAAEVNDAQYYQGKLRFLSELQRWPSLYQSSFFRNRLEARAQSNITRYTTDLRQQDFGELLFAEHGQ